MKSVVEKNFNVILPLVTRKKHLHPKELIFIMSHIFKKLKTLMHTYSHAWVLLYAFIYFPWFTYLERHVTDNYFVIHSIFDDYIPFCEYFIIPYLLWFAYIAVTLG